jgi:DNA-binding CsgD family transcriptional regulator
MKNQLLPKNHFSLNASLDVKLICQPLENYHVSFFAYIRCYDDGSVVALMNNQDIYYHHFQKEYMIAPYIPNTRLKEKFYYLALPTNHDKKFDQAYHDYENTYKIFHPMYMFERYVGYIDLFFFALSQSIPEMINTYLNNMDAFESFKIYFKNKANNIFKKADKNRILLPKHMRLNFTGLAPNDDITKNLNLLKDRTRSINQLLQLHFNTQLTTRELQSLCYLLKGRTATETAQALNISPKTVEYYIDSVKLKLNCLSRADLFDKVFDVNLIKIITNI